MSSNLEQQFGLCYDAHADTVYRFCYFKTSDKAIAEDLTQETFMKYWNYLGKGNEVGNVKGLIFQIARNLVVDYYRSKKAISLESLEEDGFEPVGTGHTEIILNAEAGIAVKLIEKLEPKYKDVVYLRLVEELSFDEIGKTLEITPNSATVRFHRGLQMLKNLVEEKN